jgi:hypothetical protein
MAASSNRAAPAPRRRPLARGVGLALALAAGLWLAVRSDRPDRVSPGPDRIAGLFDEQLMAGPPDQGPEASQLCTRGGVPAN